jgi:hypothetical protein
MRQGIVGSLIGIVLLNACAPGPGITFAPDVPDDFRAVATDAWARFGAILGDRRTCMEPVRVEVAWAFPDRARYEPDGAVITVRVPGTAPNLTASLVHEFAHHLEFTCAAQLGLRSRFLEAAGLSHDASWFVAPRYEDLPSERFAEAIVALVLGGSSGIGVPTDRASVDVVRRWVAAG